MSNKWKKIKTRQTKKLKFLLMMTKKIVKASIGTKKSTHNEMNEKFGLHYLLCTKHTTLF